MKVQLVIRTYIDKYGLSRYTQSICKALESAGIEYKLSTPDYPTWVKLSHLLLKPFGFDTKRFFTTYPMNAKLDTNAVTHLSTQQMATLLWRMPHLHPTVVTVHDIVPYLVRNDKEQNIFRHPFDFYFDEKAMQSLHKADAIIAISEFTKQTLVENLLIPEEKIEVVLYGVNHDVFRPVEIPGDFRERYGIPDDHKIILYVGAESPRKNLSRLIDAFAKLNPEASKYLLVKVGTPEYIAQYHELISQIQRVYLEENVVFINHPPEEDLVTFYNLADVFVFPSLYEGFGMPPLEAMACGTPVVCSNAASLPEVVGDAAIQVDPYDVDSIAEAIKTVLEDSTLSMDLHNRGLGRANQFTWEKTARETIEIYQRVLGSHLI